MKTKPAGLEIRYVTALLIILGQSWRKWWLTQQTNTQSGARVSPTNQTHLDVLREIGKRESKSTSGQFSNTANYNRQAEMSFVYTDTYSKDVTYILFVSLLIFASIVRLIQQVFVGAEMSSNIIVLCILILLIPVWRHLYKSISKPSPSQTTQYVATAWSEWRKLFLKSGLIYGVAKHLIHNQTRVTLEMIESCAKSLRIDTDTSNAIHLAYREYLVNLVLEFIRSKHGKSETVLTGPDTSDSALGKFESQMVPLMRAAPIFFVTHTPDVFERIIATEARRRFKVKKGSKTA